MVLSLLAWYNVDTTTRGPLLGPLAAACVRLSQLSIQQVEALDQHPQVRAGFGWFMFTQEGPYPQGQWAGRAVHEFLW